MLGMLRKLAAKLVDVVRHPLETLAGQRRQVPAAGWQQNRQIRRQSKPRAVCEELLHLSKSGLLAGLQCRKQMWLARHHPALPKEVGKSAALIAENGYQVELQARRLFPGGQEATYPLLASEEECNAATARALKSGPVFEALFVTASLSVRADIVAPVPGGVALYEVKSTLDSTATHIDDLAVQFYALEQLGWPVVSANLLHVNRDYRRGAELDPHELLATDDVTLAVRQRAALMPELIEEYRRTLAGPEPSCGIGKHCEQPHACPYKSRCWADIPEGSVFELKGNGANKYELYDEGITLLEDIPLERLGKLQQIQVLCHRNKSELFDVAAVDDFLQSLWYPLASLDFETTWSNPIPLFVGTYPYQQVPVQFSIHGKEAAELPITHHDEFLGLPGRDPRRELAQRLIAKISPEACSLSWNKSFENARLLELARDFPDLAPELQQRAGNLRDLMLPFQKKWIYRWEFRGSYSIKKVLPAVAPAAHYHDLEVQDGEEAGLMYLKMFQSRDPREIAQIRQQLLSYCRLDTFAPFLILQWVMEECAARGGRGRLGHRPEQQLSLTLPAPLVAA